MKAKHFSLSLLLLVIEATEPNNQVLLVHLVCDTNKPKEKLYSTLGTTSSCLWDALTRAKLAVCR